MGDMTIKGAVPLPQHYNQEAVSASSLKGDNAVDKKAQPIGIFLKNALSELRQLSVGSAPTLSPSEPTSFASADALQALRLSQEFLSIHEQHA